MSLSSRSRGGLLLGVLLILVGGGVAAYFLWPGPEKPVEKPLPLPGSAEYKAYARAFHVGTAALDSGVLTDKARSKLDEAIDLIPQEPAAWANRGLLQMRNGGPGANQGAAADLKHAKELAPQSSAIEALLGLLASREGRTTEAVAHYRAVVEKNPRDAAALYTLAQALSMARDPGWEAEQQRALDRILALQPNNLKVLIEKATVSAALKDNAALDTTLKRFDKLKAGWSTKLSHDRLVALHDAAKNAPDELAFAVQGLGIALQAERGYATDAKGISKASELGTSIQQFVRLQAFQPAPAPPDTDTSFTVGPWSAVAAVPELAKSRWSVVRPIWRIREQQLAETLQRLGNSKGGVQTEAEVFERVVVLANATEVRLADNDKLRLPFPGGPQAVAPTVAGLVVLDWNNDWRPDLLLAGADGLRFWQAQGGGKFVDVSKSTRLEPEVLAADYYGAWAADTDMDSDLDVVAAPRSGPVRLLRNNGDGTFRVQDTFASVRDARAFVWVDLDNDGAADAVFLDARGKLHIFFNDRGGLFSPWPLPADVGTFLGITAADVNDDGIFDLVAVRTDGAVVRISDQDRRQSWQVKKLVQWPVPAAVSPGTVTVFAEDMDNNGAVDLVVAGPHQAHVYLANEQFGFAEAPVPVAMRVLALTDLSGKGRLDALGLSADGQLLQGHNAGRKNYRSRVLWPTALPGAPLNARINTLGLGGEIECRTGMVVQKLPIFGPALHFGLGEHDDVDIVRMVWPNGVPQVELDIPQLGLLIAEQRDTTSCPFLFTHDGTGVRFVADFMWNTPLGMNVNGQAQSEFPQTTEWLKIRADQLVPRDGYYDVRVHNNFHETDYFDQLALIVVDHQAGTEIYVDERFSPTPLALQLHVTTPARPVAHAWDHHGKDATDEVRAVDGRYLDRAGRGSYKGITNDHWVEVDLGDDAPKEGPLYLIARGWTHPTNSSINAAIEQGNNERPRGLVLEVPDGKGGWKVGRAGLGFPAGKDKTMLIRLDGIDGAGVSRRFRLRTNMEIFWDFLGYARGLDAKLAKVQRPVPSSAELRYRGILEMTQKDASSPEVPHYDKVSRRQAWRDLTGYYTRFGDVTELLAKVDDRYVIMNAGDEIAFRFLAPAGPEPGWKRDFIWECDGWTKDGDPNTRFGTTVLPLPAHGVKTNDRPPGHLEDDPVYRRFPQDWRTYHTRYVTPHEFEQGLRNFRRPSDRR